MFQLRFEIEGVTELSRKLEITINRLRDMTPAFQQTALDLHRTFSQDVFETEGGVIDEDWQELSPAYAAQKSKRYPGAGILVATGRMRQSFVYDWTANMASVWNSAPYFPFHQSNKPRSRLPRRVMIKLAEAQKEHVVEIFHKYLMQSV